MRMSANVTSIDSKIQWLERCAERAANWLQDLIFPPTCGNCGRVDFRFCAGCLHELEQLPIEAHLKTLPEEGEELDAPLATGEHRGVLQNAVQAFKYNDATELSERLAARLIVALLERNWQIDVIVPVPLFAEREAERGYNQSTLLSGHLVSALGIPVRADCLKRVRDTKQQALLSQLERRKNVENAFEASEEVKALSILLVDDVITTGSTLRECASALRAKGADRIYAIAISHA